MTDPMHTSHVWCYRSCTFKTQIRLAVACRCRSRSTPLCWHGRRWLWREIPLGPKKVPWFSGKTQGSTKLPGLGALGMGLDAVWVCSAQAPYRRRGFYKCPSVDWLMCSLSLVQSFCSGTLHKVWLVSESSWSLSRLGLCAARLSTTRT